MTDFLKSKPRVERSEFPAKRDRLIAAACELLYQHGVEKTTLADIAQAADVPIGNIYYYFKTKDDIVAAVLQTHVENARAMLDQIDGRFPTPKGRIRALIAALVSQSDLIAEFGCPMGSLSSELDKRSVNEFVAPSILMRIPIDWLEVQFRGLGQRNARDLAMSLMSAYEGSALLSNTFHDPSIVMREAKRLNRWIESM